MAYPVRTVTLPAVLAGKPNGKLPKDILVVTPGLAGGVDVLLVRPAARAWRALTAAAADAGHILKAVGGADSYRSYEWQERIFRQRYTTTPIKGRPTKRWLNQTWYQRPGTAVAAVPGTSNHGFGLAVDTGEERDTDAGAESLDQPTLAWLLANEERFGFSHEVQSEPWHLRYFAGDAIPAAVLAHEANSLPTHTENDMTYIFTPEGKVLFLHAGKLVHVASPDGIDPDGINSWDLRKDPITAKRIVAAYGPVVA